jgi:hypothetical protein
LNSTSVGNRSSAAPRWRTRRRVCTITCFEAVFSQEAMRERFAQRNVDLCVCLRKMLAPRDLKAASTQLD